MTADRDRSRGSRDSTVIARTVARVVFPIILVVALALLLQGHNRPGGGFIAAVLTAAAFALVYIIYGLEYIDEELLNRPPRVPRVPGVGTGREYASVIALGLALAAGSGVVAMALGYPFLTQAVVFVEHLPVYDSLEVASALAFDVGVYVVVVASLLTILSVVGAE